MLEDSGRDARDVVDEKHFQSAGNVYIIVKKGN